MTLFIAIGTLLIALTVALLTLPLWRRKPRAESADGASMSALRAQLEQLTALKQSGVLGGTQYEEARLALERRIIEAVVSAPKASGTAAPAVSRPLLLGLGAFVCAVAVAGYAWLGTPQGLDATQTAGAAQAGTAAAGTAPPITTEQVEAMIEKIVARLKEKPDDVDGWAMLGRAYAMLGRHEQAAPALKQAVALLATMRCC